VRLDGDTDTKLEELARKENVSVNILVNRSLRKFVEWDVHAERFGFMTASRRLYGGLMNKLSDKEAREFGRSSAQSGGVEFVTFFFKKYNIENVLKCARMLGNLYGNAYAMEHTVEGDTHTLVIRHDQGPRMSAYMAESWKVTAQKLGLKSDVMETEDQIICKFSP
jgi:hypothetical protein